MHQINCFSTIGCPDKSLAEALALADKFGVSYIEVRSLHNREDLPVLMKETFGSPAALKECLSHFHASPLVWGSSFSLFGREQWPGFDDILPWLGPCQWIRILDGGKLGHSFTDEDIARCRHCLQWARERLRSFGTTARLLIETHGALADPVECRHVIDTIGCDFELLWDTHHTWRLGKTSNTESWKLLGPWVRHIHVKDSRSTIDKFEYTLPMQGEFDFPGLFSLLRSSGYSGAISLEWEKRWHPELLPLEDAFQTSP